MKYAGRYISVLLALILLSTISVAQSGGSQGPPGDVAPGLSDVAVSSNFNFNGVAPSSSREGAVALDGFINFRNTGYDVAVESEKENSTVDFHVEIMETDGDFSGQAVTRREIRETVEASPGNYTTTLEVSRDDETLMEEEDTVTVPDRVKDPENMTREELINEVRELRERVAELEEQEEPEPPMNTPDRESNESMNGDRPDEIPGGENSNRPGFVRGLLSGLFG